MDRERALMDVGPAGGAMLDVAQRLGVNGALSSVLWTQGPRPTGARSQPSRLATRWSAGNQSAPLSAAR